MAKILAVTQDTPVLTTRRNSLPALGWPGLSDIWQNSTRAVWSGKSLAATDIIRADHQFDIDEQLLAKLMVGQIIHLVITDEQLWALQPAILHLITRQPYQDVYIHLLTTSEDTAGKIEQHAALMPRVRSKTPYHKRHQLLKPDRDNLAVNYWRPTDVVLYSRRDFVELEPLPGIQYRAFDNSDEDMGPLIFVSPRQQYRFRGAVAASYHDRLRLVNDEAEQQGQRPLVLLLEPLASAAADWQLSNMLRNLANLGHEVLIVGVGRNQVAESWPLMAAHLPSVYPTHLELLQEGPVAANEIIDYINDYVYDRHVPQRRLNQVFTKVGAHSSAG